MTEAQIREKYLIPDGDEGTMRRQAVDTLVKALALQSDGKRVFVMCQVPTTTLLRRTLVQITQGAPGEPVFDGATLELGQILPSQDAWDFVVFHSDMLAGAPPRVMEW